MSKTLEQHCQTMLTMAKQHYKSRKTLTLKQCLKTLISLKEQCRSLDTTWEDYALYAIGDNII